MHMLDPTMQVLQHIAEERQVLEAAVASKFNTNKGVVPVVGVRSGPRAGQSMQALGWRLNAG